MPSESYPQLLVGSQVAGTALASSTTATSILPGQARFTMPANFIDVIGKKFRITASGRISTVVTTPGTLTLDVRFNSTPIIVTTSQAFALNTVAKSAVSWSLDLLMTVRAVGSGTSANLLGMGLWESEAVIGSPLPSVGGIGAHSWQASSPVVGTGFDSTVANVVDLFAKWSVNSGSNSITCEDYALESLN